MALFLALVSGFNVTAMESIPEDGVEDEVVETELQKRVRRDHTLAAQLLDEFLVNREPIMADINTRFDSISEILSKKSATDFFAQRDTKVLKKLQAEYGKLVSIDSKTSIKGFLLDTGTGYASTSLMISSGCSQLLEAWRNLLAEVQRLLERPSLRPSDDEAVAAPVEVVVPRAVAPRDSTRFAPQAAPVTKEVFSSGGASAVSSESFEGAGALVEVGDMSPRQAAQVRAIIDGFVAKKS